MPHGFVDLQPKLRAFQDDIERAFGALIGLVQRDSFFADSARVLNQLQLINQFIAFVLPLATERSRDRKSTRLNSSHLCISYAVFCLKKKKQKSLYVSNTRNQ